MDAAPVPAPTVTANVSAPSAPMSYRETSPVPKFAVYTYGPVGLTIMSLRPCAPPPAITDPVPIVVNPPTGPMAVLDFGGARVPGLRIVRDVPVPPKGILGEEYGLA